MDVETVSVEELTPDPENTRLHPEENLEAIQASLARFGQVLPLVVHAETGIVIGGNGMLAAIQVHGQLQQGCRRCRKVLRTSH